MLLLKHAAKSDLDDAAGNAQPCGVDYELKSFVADSVEDKIHKRNSVVLAIRKLTYAPEEPAPQPNADAVKEFMMCSGNLRLEVTLDKEVIISLCIRYVMHGRFNGYFYVYPG